MRVSATYNGSNITLVDIDVNGLEIYTTYIDAVDGSLKVGKLPRDYRSLSTTIATNAESLEGSGGTTSGTTSGSVDLSNYYTKTDLNTSGTIPLKVLSVSATSVSANTYRGNSVSATTVSATSINGISSTVLSYLDVSASIQTQLNSKVTGDLSNYYTKLELNTSGTVPIKAASVSATSVSANTYRGNSVSATTVSATSINGISSTVLSYLDVSASIQTQLNSKGTISSATNIGTGSTIYTSSTGNSLNLRTIKASTGIAIATNDTEIQISYAIDRLPVSNGGTNSSTALTNGKVMVSNGGAIVESSITSATLGYLDVSASVQTQLNSKTTGDLSNYYTKTELNTSATVPLKVLSVSATTISASKYTGVIKTVLWPPGAETSRSITLNGETYYFVVISKETAIWSGIMIECAVTGADPSNLTAALYNSSGTKIGSEQTAVAALIGGVKVPFAPTLVTEGTLYVIGISGDSSNSTFRGTTVSDNNTSTNRTGGAALEATVPTGVSTATRLNGQVY